MKSCIGKPPSLLSQTSKIQPLLEVLCLCALNVFCVCEALWRSPAVRLLHPRIRGKRDLFFSCNHSATVFSSNKTVVTAIPRLLQYLVHIEISPGGSNMSLAQLVCSNSGAKQSPHIIVGWYSAFPGLFLPDHTADCWKCWVSCPRGWCVRLLPRGGVWLVLRSPYFLQTGD